MNPVEAMARQLCIEEGVDPEWPCAGLGNLIPLGETWPAWKVRMPKARAAFVLAFNAIAHTGKVDPFALADAGVAILGNANPPAPTAAAPLP